MAAIEARRKVGVLLLGSGWTSRFLLPRLAREHITHAYTTRQEKPSSDQGEGSSSAYAATSSLVITFKIDAARAEVESDAEHASRLRQACATLPQARMLVVVFPLPQSSNGKDVARLVEAYESATACTPAWLALGSTGAWGKGCATSSTLVLPTNARAQAESELLALNNFSRRTAVLNFAGLYGHQRNPANFAKRVADSKEKLAQKTSVHLVHGQDVAQAIVGMYRALDDERQSTVWGRRWIVTDTHVYDWWQLLDTLRPPPVPQGVAWTKELMTEHGIKSLPRPGPSGTSGENEKSSAPHVLERVLDGSEFWRALGSQPEIGRCDDYGANGGGISVESSL